MAGRCPTPAATLFYSFDFSIQALIFKINVSLRHYSLFLTRLKFTAELKAIGERAGLGTDSVTHTSCLRSHFWCRTLTLLVDKNFENMEPIPTLRAHLQCFPPLMEEIMEGIWSFLTWWCYAAEIEVSACRWWACRRSLPAYPQQHCRASCSMMSLHLASS